MDTHILYFLSVKTTDGSADHHNRVGELRCKRQAAASAAPDEQRCTSQATRRASEPTWVSTDLLEGKGKEVKPLPEVKGPEVALKPKDAAPKVKDAALKANEADPKSKETNSKATDPPISQLGIKEDPPLAKS
nr:hypothetical protein CFP56_44905 [Quercus suber]